MEDDKIIIVNDEDAVKKKNVSIVPVEQIEKEFEGKSLALSDDFFEVDMKGFLAEIFERETRTGEIGEQPFEEVQSLEYQNWKQQDLQLAVKRGKGVPEEQLKVDYSGYGCWRYNPIAFYREVAADGKKKNRHRIILKDDNESLDFLSGRKFAIMSPITYVGRNNTQENARFLYALAFDIDGVSLRKHHKMFDLVERKMMPMPNIIVNSGHGYHLYYLLENPIALYPVIVPLLNRLKHGLTNILWNMGTSEIEDRQYQSILQSFRLPGTLTKFGKRIRSFVTGANRYNLEELNEYLYTYKLSPEELSICEGKAKYNPQGVTLSEAERKWPEWYAARVLRRERVGKKWHVNRSVYDWWHNALLSAGDEIKVHHRYWCVLTLIIYAVKCDISREEVLNDAYALVPKLDSYTDNEDNHFTKGDVNDAMVAFDKNYSKWPIKTIEDTTMFRIERNRRNGRKQKEHLVRARFSRDLEYKNWREGNGRPVATAENSKEYAAILQWRKDNPDSKNKSQCATDLTLSRPTVRKWWNVIDGIEIVNKRKPQVASASPQVARKDSDKKDHIKEPDMTKEPILIFMAKIFLPGAESPVPGYTIEQVREIVTSGKWEELGWDLCI